MKKVLLILFVLILSNAVFSQCLCGKLRFAIDDDSSKYTYYAIVEENKYRIKFHSFSDQSHINLTNPKKSLFKHHSYMTYDKNKDEIVTKTFDKKHFVLLDIDPGERKFIVEIVEKESKKKMAITFIKNSIDVSYNILTDFVPGSYEVNATELKQIFQKDYEKEKIVYKGSKLKAISSDSKKSSGNDWMKIVDMKKFKK